MAPTNQLVRDRAQNRIRGRRVGFRAFVSAKPAREGIGAQAQRYGLDRQEAVESVRRVTIARLRRCLFVRSPSRSAQGVSSL
jgi:hypothetical protein